MQRLSLHPVDKPAASWVSRFRGIPASFERQEVGGGLEERFPLLRAKGCARGRRSKGDGRLIRGWFEPRDRGSAEPRRLRGSHDYRRINAAFVNEIRPRGWPPPTSDASSEVGKENSQRDFNQLAGAPGSTTLSGSYDSSAWIRENEISETLSHASRAANFNFPGLLLPLLPIPTPFLYRELLFTLSS